MNRLYTAARMAFLRGEIDVTTDTLKAALTVAPFVEDTVEFYDDVSADVLDAPVTLANVAVDATEPWVTADDVVFANATPATVVGLVIYRDSGVAATSRLLAWIDHRGDTQPLSITTNGGDVTIKFPANKVFRL